MSPAPAPLIGIDLDNTLVSYDRLFHTLALEQGLIPADLAVNKTAVRDYLRSIGQEPAWTAMQGVGYGNRIREAEIFPGALEFLKEGRRRGWTLYIVSHKTKQPIVGEPVDLHDAARGWLESKTILNVLPRENVYFELTKSEKIERLRALGCTVFIDDLPELLTDAKFPASVRRILFDPQNLNSKSLPADIVVTHSWAEITQRLTHELA